MHTIAIANQKGGVGKTTSAINISTELALLGRRVLLIDLDPQGNATSGLSIPFAEEGADLYDVFFGKIQLESVIRESQIERLYVAPASSDLVGIEIELGKKPGRELILRSEIALIKEKFDYVIIDCPPSSGLLTLNALGAANGVLIPLQAEYYALEGISALTRTIDFVKQTFNPELSVLGVFVTMYIARTNLSMQVEQEARSFFGDIFIGVRVPRSVKIAESPSHGKPLSVYDPGSPGAKAFRAIAMELDVRCNTELKTETAVANG